MESDAKNILAIACHAMLRPIIRILLRCGMTFQEFNAHAKTVFIDVCGKEYGLRGRQANASRVAIMTGLSRREIRRQRACLPQDPPTRMQPVDRASRVLAGWHDNPDFIDSSGTPAALSENGPEPSFATLFARYGGDVPMTAMLKELIRSGAVETTNDGHLRALHRYYMPQQTDSVTIERAAQVLGDIGATIYYNLNRRERDPSNFEGRATNLSVPASTVPAFRDSMEEKGEEFLDQADRWLGEHEDETKGERFRLGVGMYFISSQEFALDESAPSRMKKEENKK